MYSARRRGRHIRIRYEEADPARDPPNLGVSFARRAAVGHSAAKKSSLMQRATPSKDDQISESRTSFAVAVTKPLPWPNPHRTAGGGWVVDLPLRVVASPRLPTVTDGSIDSGSERERCRPEFGRRRRGRTVWRRCARSGVYHLTRLMDVTTARDTAGWSPAGSRSLLARSGIPAA